MGPLYLGGPTIQEVDGKMMMGLSIYGVAVISGSLYSRFYGILLTSMQHHRGRPTNHKIWAFGMVDASHTPALGYVQIVNQWNAATQCVCGWCGLLVNI